MSAVVKAVESVVDTVGDVISSVGKAVEDVGNAIGDAVESVGKTVEKTVQGALKDPIGTIAKVAAVATGNIELLPYISAADVVAHGGSPEDAIKAGLTSMVAQEAGSYVGDQVSAAQNYGTDLGSQQTAMLAAQDAGLGTATAAGRLAGAATGAGTGAALSGGNVENAVVNALADSGLRLGVDYAMDAAGNAIDSAGRLLMGSNEVSPPNQPTPEFSTDTRGPDELVQVDQPNEEVIRSANDGLEEVAQPGELTQPTLTDTRAPDELVQVPEPSPDLVAQLEASNAPQEIPPPDQPTPETSTDARADNELVQVPEVPDGATPAEVPMPLEEHDPLSTDTRAPDELVQVPEPEVTPERDLDAVTAEPTPTTPAVDPAKAMEYLRNQFMNSLIASIAANATANRNAPTTTTPGATTAATATPAASSAFNYIEPGIVQGSKIEPESIAPKGEILAYNPATFATVNPFVLQALQDQQYRDMSFNPEIYAAAGGPIGHNPEFFSEGGNSIHNRYVKGDGDGTSDSVPAMLASGEFVIPADVVSGLGNGDNDAGAKVLDEFMMAIRKHKRAASPDELPEDSRGPLSYLQEALKKVRR